MDTLQKMAVIASSSVSGPSWKDASPQGYSYLDIFSEGVCRVIPECASDTTETRKSRMKRIQIGLQTLFPQGPAQLLNDYNSLASTVGAQGDVLPTTGNIVPSSDNKMWLVLRMVMRFHAASEAPTELLGRTHVVAPGQSPMVIAEIYTRDRNRYTELIASNKQIPAVPVGSVGLGGGGGGHGGHGGGGGGHGGGGGGHWGGGGGGWGHGGHGGHGGHSFHPSYFYPGIQLNVPVGWDYGYGYGYLPYYEYLGYGYPLQSTDALKRRLTPEEFWAEVSRPRSGLPVSADWLKKAKDFVASFKPGDEIWYYSASRGPLNAEDGYYLLRNGKVVASLIGVVS